MDSHDENERIRWPHRIPKSQGQNVHEETAKDYRAMHVQIANQRPTERSGRHAGSQMAQRHLPRLQQGFLGVPSLGRQPYCQVSSRAALEEMIEVAKASVRKDEERFPQHIFGDGSRQVDAISNCKR